jgi:hypothetical protein
MVARYGVHAKDAKENARKGRKRYMAIFAALRMLHFTLRAFTLRPFAWKK